MIERAAVEEMFRNINSHASWDLSKPMLWGYFFIDADAQRLQDAVPALEELGYRFVSIFESEHDDTSAPHAWWLHVERKEVHTVDSLCARHAALEEFAETHGLQSYDGADVGPAKP